jgi:NADH-quinone oxidoreductase subunit H
MDWIDALLIPVVKALIVIVGLLVGFAYMTYAERKLVARFTVRYGPNRAGRFGLVQPVADAFKALFKEEVIPNHVDRLVYIIAPGFAMAMALITFAVVPLTEPFRLFGREMRFVVGDLNVGLLFILATAGLGLYGIFLGGWASNNNFSLMGALRSTAQILTYELPMALALVSLVVVAGSLRLVDIVDVQARIPLIVLQPIGFLIYFIAGMSEANRSPFDLPETENELVSGFSTEYGGIKFAIFFMAEYINMIVIAIIAATLFLGAWHGPFAQYSPLIQLFWVFLKTAVLLFLFVWIRASIPRVRYDKWMTYGWKFMMPLAVVNLAVTAIVVVLLA